MKYVKRSEHVQPKFAEPAFGKKKPSKRPHPISMRFNEVQLAKLKPHAHTVWCRVDADKMKAIHLPFTKLKLRDVSRELHVEHGLRMPDGLINSKDRDPRNFSFEQWQQCKRTKTDFRQVQGDFRDAWAMSDNQASFAHAPQERGYILAEGRRGFVAVDYKETIFAVRQYAGVQSKDVNAKLGSTAALGCAIARTLAALRHQHRRR